jgi:hypothetical protein
MAGKIISPEQISTRGARNLDRRVSTFFTEDQKDFSFSFGYSLGGFNHWRSGKKDLCSDADPFPICLTHQAREGGELITTKREIGFEDFFSGILGGLPEDSVSCVSNYAYGLAIPMAAHLCAFEDDRGMVEDAISLFNDERVKRNVWDYYKTSFFANARLAGRMFSHLGNVMLRQGIEYTANLAQTLGQEEIRAHIDLYRGDGEKRLNGLGLIINAMLESEQQVRKTIEFMESNAGGEAIQGFGGSPYAFADTMFELARSTTPRDTKIIEHGESLHKLLLGRGETVERVAPQCVSEYLSTQNAFLLPDSGVYVVSKRDPSTFYDDRLLRQPINTIEFSGMDKYSESEQILMAACNALADQQGLDFGEKVVYRGEECRTQKVPIRFYSEMGRDLRTEAINEVIDRLGMAQQKVRGFIEDQARKILDFVD